MPTSEGHSLMCTLSKAASEIGFISGIVTGCDQKPGLQSLADKQIPGSIMNSFINLQIEDWALRD